MSRTCFAGSPPAERRPRYRPELLHCVCGFLSALFHAVGCLLGALLDDVPGFLGSAFGGVLGLVGGFRGGVTGFLRCGLGRVAGVLSRLLDVATYILTVSKRGEGEHSQRKFQFHGSSRSEFWDW